jgi:hypothetical protein
VVATSGMEGKSESKFRHFSSSHLEVQLDDLTEGSKALVGGHEARSPSRDGQKQL